MAPRGAGAYTEVDLRQAVTEFSPLQAEIDKLIRSSGPMPVWRYMKLCLTHPEHGYYVSRDPLGREGDFTMAPEVSQMFGELLGLWTASVWKASGRHRRCGWSNWPRPRHHDRTRFARSGCCRCSINRSKSISSRSTPCCAKSSGRRCQAQATSPGMTASTSAGGARGHSGQRIFDVLPIHQVVKRETGGTNASSTSMPRQAGIGASDDPMPRFEVLLPPLVRAAPVGAVFEWRPDTEMMKIATRVRQQDGAALIIDYGHLRSDAGDTFQAIARHSFADPLKNPGQADVTAHVDFQALARAAEDVGARVHGPVTQGDYLKRLGIETRALTLMGKTRPEVSADIAAALKRLTDSGRGGMDRCSRCLRSPNPI